MICTPWLRVLESFSNGNDLIVRELVTGKVVNLALTAFVDDLAANVIGVPQALRVQILIGVVSKCAGLLTDTHECQWLCASSVSPLAYQVLAFLPVRVSNFSDHVRLSGYPPHLLDALLSHAIGRDWAVDKTGTSLSLLLQNQKRLGASPQLCAMARRHGHCCLWPRHGRSHARRVAERSGSDSW